jgi:EamA domain-containing membrane protein RarD
VKTVPVVEVLCHRVVWALAVLAVVIAVRGEMRAVTAALRNRRALLVAPQMERRRVLLTRVG